MLFSFSGIVKKHLQRGGKLGYPTANVDIDQNTPDGIYVGLATIDNVAYHSLIFIGKPLTFDEFDKKAEVFILDFKKDIYDKFIEVNVYKKLRDNIKFDSKELLIKQIKEDESQARKYFDNLLQ